MHLPPRATTGRSRLTLVAGTAQWQKDTPAPCQPLLLCPCPFSVLRRMDRKADLKEVKFCAFPLPLSAAAILFTFPCASSLVEEGLEYEQQQPAAGSVTRRGQAGGAGQLGGEEEVSVVRAPVAVPSGWGQGAESRAVPTGPWGASTPTLSPHRGSSRAQETFMQWDQCRRFYNFLMADNMKKIILSHRYGPPVPRRGHRLTVTTSQNSYSHSKRTGSSDTADPTGDLVRSKFVLSYQWPCHPLHW